MYMYVHDDEVVCLLSLSLGTRYRRRGVDSLGNVANYVETEMVLGVSTTLAVVCVYSGAILPVVFVSDPAGRVTPCVVRTRERVRPHLLDPAWNKVSPSSHH